MNRDIARFIGAEKWLVTEHKRFPTLPLLDEAHSTVCGPKTRRESVARWLKGLDVIVFAEMLELPFIPEIARSMGIKTVCIPMVECIPFNREWWKHVDLWIAPTAYSYQRLTELVPRGRKALCPWPIDTIAIPFQQRTKCQRYVYAHGNGGPLDRKGGKIVAEAARLTPEVPLTVYSQVQDGIHSSRVVKVDWPDTVDFRGSAGSPADIYREGDVFLLPSRWEGLGLQLFECQAAGMPLITTDGPPMNEASPWKLLPCTEGKKNLGYDFTSFNADPADLARLMRENLGVDITEASRSARDWVVANRSWQSQSKAIRAKILEA